MRQWDDRLLEAIERHRQAPFSWGRSDCFRLAMEAAEAVTGTDPYRAELGRYTSERGALLRLRRNGFADVAEALAAVFPEAPMAQARRGDLAVWPENPLGVGVVMGAVVVGKHPAQGWVQAPLSPALRYFAVRRRP